MTKSTSQDTNGMDAGTDAGTGHYHDTYGSPERARSARERAISGALDVKYPTVAPMDYASATALAPSARHVCDESFICDLSPVEDADALPKWCRIVRTDPEEYEREVFAKFRRLDGPSDAYHFLKGRMAREEVEMLVVICLDVAHNVICAQEVHRGTDDTTPSYTRDIFRIAVAKGAHSVVVCHNHPSGTPEPSDADKEVTKRAAYAGAILGIPLMDHIIIAPHGYTSLSERGLC